MGTIQFTPEQRQIIEAKECSTLVAAAAGSGKTAVLVQRIIEKLLDKEQPQDVTRLLVVTYTNAAAAEMRERIGKRLTECLASEEHADSIHLQKQVLLLRNAPIMTIHGFCLSLLREFFYELDIDPGFRIAEEAELTLLRADVLDELLEECYAGGNELFLRLTECVGSGKNDEALIRHLEHLYKFAQSAPFPEHWLSELSKELEVCGNATELDEDAPCMLCLKEHIRALCEDCMELCDRALELCQGPEGPYVYAEALEADKELLRTLCGKESYEELSEAFETLSFQALSRKKCEASEECREQVKAIRAEYKDILGKLKKDYFFAKPQQLAADMAAMAPLMRELTELCREYGRRYAEAKTERALVDFNDLEHLAVRLLVEETEEGIKTTEMAKLLRTRFDEVMVDECQDSNRIQDLLLWSVSGEEDGHPNRFMVGDVKQSIYKFRMAMPELFIQKYDRYETEGPYRKIVLGKNFRSRRAVVDAVNDIFFCLMRKEFGGVAYDAAARLYLGAEYPWDGDKDGTERKQYTAELMLTELRNEEAAEEGTDRIMREAMTVGARIKELVTEQLPIYTGEEKEEDGEKKKITRPVSYGDITILFRAMSGYAEPFLEVFSELGIPAVAETQSGYFNAQEVAVVLNALRVIDNPQQDIPLVSVLRSEMFALTEEELAIVRIAAKEREEGGGGSFYEAVCGFCTAAGEEKFLERLAARTEQKEEFALNAKSAAEKLNRFLDCFAALREQSAYAGVPEILAELYRRTAYPDYMRVKPAGARRVENLSMLAAKAKKFEESSYSGIFDFVRYIDRLIKYDMDTGEAQSAAGEDAVHLMSIHKSKGLEAPVVIVAGLSKQFNRMDIRTELVMHPELGMGMDFRDEVLRVKAPTLYKKVIAGRLNYEMLSEELRIFYVALTRAKEKLILSAAVPLEADFLKSMKQEAADGQASYLSLYSANSYLDFLKLPLQRCLERGSLRIVSAKCGERQAETAAGAVEREFMLRRERLAMLADRDLTETADALVEAELAERKAYVYPYPLCSGKMKLSVSELKKAAYQEELQEELFPEAEPVKIIPRFLQKEEREKLSGSERGTLYHRIMECMDFSKEYPDLESVASEMRRLTEAGLLRKDAEEFVSPQKIFAFFCSDLGGRMQKAARSGSLQKEQPFVIGLPYHEVYKGECTKENNKEYVMVQGIMDACFLENDAWVLVDYKTDAVKEKVREVLRARYRTQLAYYAQALRQMTGIPVADCIIYAFANGEAFSVGEENM